MYSQYTITGYSAHVLPNFPMQAQNVFMVLLGVCSRCGLNVNLSLKVTPRYLTPVDTIILESKMVGHWSLESFLLHVNGTIVVFLELSKSFSSAPSFHKSQRNLHPFGCIALRLEAPHPKFRQQVIHYKTP